MDAFIHEPHQKPILAWIYNRLFLTDSQQQMFGLVATPPASNTPKTRARHEMTKAKHDHALAAKLYARPDKDPTPATEDTPVNNASWRIDDLVRRLVTREITFAELHESVKAELGNVFEAGHKENQEGN